MRSSLGSKTLSILLAVVLGAMLLTVNGGAAEAAVQGNLNISFASDNCFSLSLVSPEKGILYPDPTSMATIYLNGSMIMPMEWSLVGDRLELNHASGVTAVFSITVIDNPITGGSGASADLAEFKLTVTNGSAEDQTVAGMMFFDTCIGENDGAPLYIPGVGKTSSETTYLGEHVPAIVYSLEVDDLSAPGFVATFLTDYAGNVTPNRVTLGNWYTMGGMGYDYNGNGSDIDDSAILAQWNNTVLSSGETLEFTMFMGRGVISAAQGSKFQVSAAGDAEVGTGGSYRVMQTVRNISGVQLSNVDASIALPDGWAFASGDGTATKATLANEEDWVITWELVAPPGTSSATFELLAQVQGDLDSLVTLSFGAEFEPGEAALAPLLDGGLSFADVVGIPNNGMTQILLGAPSTEGNTFRYLISSDNSPVPTPTVGYDAGSWTLISDGATIAVANGTHIGVAEVDGSGKVVQFSDATAVVVNEYLLTYVAGEHGNITGSLSQTVSQGSSGTEVTAVPDIGYHFVNWSDGSTDPSRTDSNVTNDITVTANFAQNVALTVTAEPTSKVYGDADPALTYQVTAGALDPGDSFTGVLTRAAGSDVGAYQITQGTLTAGPKYDITFVPADLTINVRPVAVRAVDQTKTYGTSDPALTYELISGTLATGDSFDGALQRATGESVGVYQVQQGTLALSSNYSLTFTPGTLGITPRSITVSANARSKVYGDVEPALTYSITAGSLVNGDSMSGGLQREAGENAGAYAITQGALSAGGNYNLTYIPATFTIQPRSLTVTADDKVKTYDGIPYDGGYTVSYSGFAPGDDASDLGGALSYSGSALLAEDAGDYVITPAGLASSNYAITFVDGRLSIAKRTLTVTANNHSKVYDGQTYVGFTASYAGFAAGEDESMLGGTLAFGGSASTAVNVGGYGIAPSGLTSANYQISFIDGTLTVAAKALSATASASGKVYDGTTAASGSISLEGLVDGDVVTAAGTFTFDNADAGNGKTVNVTGINLSGAKAGNYTVNATTSTTADIARRAVVITANPQTKTYGDDDPVLTYTGMLVGTDTFTGSLSRLAGENVGSYAIQQGTLSAGDNYNLTYVPASLTITKKFVMVTADAKTKIYGDDDPVLTYTGTLVGTDAFTGSLSRLAGENVGGYAIQQGSLSAGDNYTLIYVPANLTIAKKSVTVTAIAQTKTYGDDDPALTYTGTLLGTDAFTGSLSRVAGESVGSYAIQQGTLSASNNYDLTYVPANLTIAKKSVTVTADAKTKTYGDDDPALTYSGTLVGTDTFTGSLSRATGENFGTYEIQQGTLSAGDNYNLNYVPAYLTITKKSVTVTADAKTKTYGDDDPVLTYSGTLVGTDAFTGSLSRVAGENVDTYEIQQGTLSAGDNYALIYVPANLTIAKKSVTVTAIAQTKTYGDDDPALTYTGTLVGTDAFTGSLSRVAGENVGTYEIQQGTLSAGGNYNLTYVPANLTIAKKSVTVTADAKTKTYGDDDPALTYSGTLVGTDAFTGLLSRVAGENVGSYAIQQGTLSAGSNYDLTYVPASLTIAKKSVTVTADAKTKTYGDNDPALTYSGTLVGTDTFTGLLSRVAGEDVGSYEIQQGTLSAGDNYNLSYVPAYLTITKKSVTVTADAKTKTYGDEDPALTYTGTLVGTDTFTGSLSRVAGENVDTYEIQQGTLSAGDNYNLTYVPAILTITKKSITVTADAKTKTYGDDDPVLTYSGTLVGTDTFTGSLSRVAGENVGSYAIQQGTLSAGDNYNLTYVPANLTITKKSITVTAIAQTKTYGDDDPVLTYTGTLVGTDTFTGSLSRVAGENVGSYEIQQGTLSAGDNYNLSYVPAYLTITKKSVTVTADAKTKTYGDDDLVLTYTGTLVGTDTFTGSLSRAAGENVGTYEIQQGTLSASNNYDLTYVPANLTITKKSVTVTANAQTKTYGGADPHLSYVAPALVGSDGFTGSLNRTSGSGVGDYEIVQGSLSAGDNYNIVYVHAYLTITPKSVSAVGITAGDKLYDGTTNAALNLTGAHLVGQLAYDDVTLCTSNAKGEFADSLVAKDKMVTVTGLSLSGRDASNYVLAPYTTTASIVDLSTIEQPITSGINILVNGQTQENAATATTEVEDGRIVTTVVIGSANLSEMLQQEGEQAVVSIPVNTGAEVVVGELNGQMVRDMENSSAVLQVQTDRVTYTLPAAQINIGDVSQQIGTEVSLQDIQVLVQVAEPTQGTVQVVEDAANSGHYSIVVRPVQFTITCTHQDQTVEVDRFNAYVERTVSIPEGVDPSKITTGVVLNDDGTFSHVPTTVIVIDGRYYARINSLTNSVYSVIWNPLTFADTRGHWAEGPVNDMASRLVMQPDSIDNFGPNRAITRGEFAATIVKALGLQPGTGASPFADVKPGDEYFGYILTASEYRIMGGYPDNTFRANRQITREEAMSMIVAAMRVTKLSSGLQPGEGEQLLASYADGRRVSGWARGVVANCLKSGIMGGRPGMLIDPKASITRAEVAAIVQRLLRQSKLI